MSTFLNALVGAAATDRGVRFIARDEGSVFFTYTEVASRAARIAGGLQTAGIKPGDTVAIVLPTGPEFYDAFFGAMWLGAIPVPLYPPQRLGKLDEFHTRTAAMLTAVRARVVLTDKRVRRLLGQAVERARPTLGCICIDTLQQRAVPSVGVRPSDIALIQFSSGTTVDPKPVALTHAQVLANATAISNSLNEDLAVNGKKRAVNVVSWLPLYHDMGLIGCMLTCIHEPSNLVLIPPEVFVAHPAIWLRTISKYRGNISAAPNFAYSFCAERIRDGDLVGVDLSSWDVALNGAEPVTLSAMVGFSDRFAPYGFRPEALTPVYGLAEATLAVTFSPVRSPFHAQFFDAALLADERVARPSPRGQALVSLGQPLDGNELRILDDDGHLLPPHHCGHIMVRGPSVMRGYFGRPEATQASLRDGWLDTGDIGFLHGQELYITGRAKDVIILRGRNYAPQDIEQHIDTITGVRTGCSIAVGFMPDEAAGEALLLLVERHSGNTSAEDTALANEVRSTVLAACNVLADEVVILEPGTLPRTSSGKLRRQAALRHYLDGTLSAPLKTNPWRLAGEMLRSQLALNKAGSDRDY